MFYTPKYKKRKTALKEKVLEIFFVLYFQNILQTQFQTN